MENKDSGPGALAPPPVIYLVAFAVGLGLDWLVPIRLWPSAIGTVLGIALAAASLALVAWAVATFRRARTSVNVYRPARALVTAGPYRLSRNPMYLALTLLYLGVAVWLDRVWAIATLPAAIIALDRGVIRREEAHLLRRFADAYHAYRRRVRRWL